MGIFAVFIGGEKYYFQGDLNDYECREIEQLCANKLLEKDSDSASDEVFNDLLTDVSSTLGKEIVPRTIQYVFRIK